MSRANRGGLNTQPEIGKGSDSKLGLFVNRIPAITVSGVEIVPLDSIMSEHTEMRIGWSTAHERDGSAKRIHTDSESLNIGTGQGS